jgi:outer membrane translocation and assembly module TamA
VIVNRFVVGDESVTISGETSGFNIVDDIKNRLEQSNYFHEVTIASANMDKSGKKVRFKLKIEYEEN